MVALFGQMMFYKDVHHFWDGRLTTLTLRESHTLAPTDRVFRVTFEDNDGPLGMVLANRVRFVGPPTTLECLDGKSSEMLHDCMSQDMRHSSFYHAPPPQVIFEEALISI
ncbi:hypothetical protein CALCODRAFT_489968 [Calocera cornea HHB12733]|uniref:Uncharacterized protein n=1 Tax=Calocera cornea HHB12733 TaxID=1353952 RepID=A0A165K241_9BASI|nr:hypothetical protein CALCODRAFT_489968 [Calocera cornea HHB12733]